MKFLFCIFLFLASSVHAQVVGLSNKEVGGLKRLIKKDSEVTSLYRPILKRADEAMGQSPDPVDTVVSEGHLANDPRKIFSGRSLKDIDKIYSLALAWKIEGKEKYLHKAIDYLTAWATVNKPQGNPINDTKFENLFFAYDLVKNGMMLAQRKAVEAWLRRMADEEMRTGQNKARKTSYNNWNSHRLKVIGFIAYLLDDPVYKDYVNKELPIQIEKNLLPDGSGIDFLERDALHYHIYTLEPLISLATLLKRATGMDFYHFTSPSGASIKKSIDFLLPFARGEKAHHEFVNSKVAFDKKRADNNEPGYKTGADFKPATARSVLIEAAWFEPSCMEIARQVMHTRDRYPTWQAVINDVRDGGGN